ncbi:hypothetical protein RRG08_055261 [Elysia crispata]|uniref:Uncharacterized protein n=1 Tax=Elysia crispata TaxID=231223 RepID=A0AAE0ZVT0_9GAST|nr:hypothetical protein RRG08_055261 [Elysia crispata]
MIRRSSAGTVFNGVTSTPVVALPVSSAVAHSHTRVRSSLPVSLSLSPPQSRFPGLDLPLAGHLFSIVTVPRSSAWHREDK